MNQGTLGKQDVANQPRMSDITKIPTSAEIHL